MSVPVACNSCGQKFKAPEAMRGKSTKCPKCGGAIAVPPAAAPDIGDLLDDVPQTAPPEDAQPTASANPRARKCRQCGDELPEGSRYCLVCGCNNFDLDGQVAQVNLDYDKRYSESQRHWLIDALLSWFRWR